MGTMNFSGYVFEFNDKEEASSLLRENSEFFDFEGKPGYYQGYGVYLKVNSELLDDFIRCNSIYDISGTLINELEYFTDNYPLVKYANWCRVADIDKSEFIDIIWKNVIEELDIENILSIKKG